MERPGLDLSALKDRVRKVGASYPDRIDRTRRLFIQDAPVALEALGDVQYLIKREVSEFFSIAYGHVHFAGSAQLGFSVHKDKLFEEKQSDLDIACVSPSLFQEAWMDAARETRAFTNDAAFGTIGKDNIAWFKEAIFKRGMIKIGNMPITPKSQRWRLFEQRMSKKYREHFGSVSFAIYMNEYAFCWKQDSAISEIMRD